MKSAQFVLLPVILLLSCAGQGESFALSSRSIVQRNNVVTFPTELCVSSRGHSCNRGFEKEGDSLREKSLLYASKIGEAELDEAELTSAAAVENDNPTSPRQGGRLEKVKKFASKNFFVIGMFVAVASARLFPALGKNGGILRPELFIGRFGVTMIFLLSGLSIKLSEIGDAAKDLKLNLLIQLMTFAAWPYLVGLPLTSFFGSQLPGFFPPALLDGLLILTCLPTTVNMCVVLASSANGNTASALWNSIISNLGGIFLTPFLLFRFFGAAIELPFVDMFFKLCNKVLVPVAIGQALRKTPVLAFYEKHENFWKRFSEVILLSILWNALCTAISSGLGLSLKHGLALAALLPAIQVASLGALFKFFSMPRLGLSRKNVVSAVYCASQKTLAFGLPLLQTIFEGNANLALYCAPLMLFHPLELMLGSAIIPRLERYTRTEDSEELAQPQLSVAGA